MTGDDRMESKKDAAEKRADDKRKLWTALSAALAVPQNVRVLIELSKR